MLVLASASVASLVSDAVWYWIGRLRGARVLGWLCRISLEPDSCVKRTSRLFSEHGVRSLLFAKFVPGFSTVAPPLAGIVRMPSLPFLVFTGLGGALWAGAFLALGWVFSAELERMAIASERLGGWLVAAVVGALGAYIGWKVVARQRFLRGLRIARITADELKAKLDAGEGLIVVDLRDAIDFDAEPLIIPGALRLTVDDLEARHAEIPREREIVLYCT